MKATDILMEEHQLIERLLNALEAAAQKLEQGRATRPELFLEAVDFNLVFTDGCHRRKEEGALFPALVAHGMPERTGPIVALLHEHSQGREYSGLVREAVRRWQAGDDTARTLIVATVYQYVELLRQHIHKENSILFQMATRIIPPEAQDRLVAAFERIEREDIGAGAKPKYRALVETLEREAWT